MLFSSSSIYIVTKRIVVETQFSMHYFFPQESQIKEKCIKETTLMINSVEIRCLRVNIC